MMSSGSTVTVRVQMLDNSIHMYDVKLNSNGIVLLQAVLKDLNLLEADYFGILYRNGESDEFLDPLKKLKLQIPNISTTVLKFAVKFFPPDPGQLQEEYTRYLFALQIKQDILHGQLTCTDNTLAVLTSCIVQSEFGDWNAQECSDLTYLKDLKILPDKPNEGNILVKISEHHKTNMGLTSAEADAHLLDIVRRVELYGLRLQPAVDPAKTKISLAVSFAGVVVLQNNSRINLFSWSLIRKLSFKKNKLLVKLKAKLSSDKYYADSGDVLVFVMKSRDACKSFWRRCIEHHSFFRVEEHRPRKGPPPRLLRKGSTYRYTGKTQKQLHDLVSSSNFSRSSFNRASRRRTTASKNNESVFSPSIQETSTNLENSFKSSIPGNDDSVHTKPPGFTSLEITNHDKSEGSVVLSRDTSSGPTMTSWQEKSGDLRSGNNAVAPHNGKLDSADEVKLKKELASCLNQKNASPVHLHSGGALQPSPIQDHSRFSSPTTSVTPQFSLLSSNQLKQMTPVSEGNPPSSQAYFIAKEILTTERTYIKDLQVVVQWFQSAISEIKDILPTFLFTQLIGGAEELLAIHRPFLQDLETRFASWESRGFPDTDQRVDDIMLRHMISIGKHLETIENAETIITRLEQLANDEVKFEEVYRNFELEKVCYLPFSSFILKPMQRVIHYKTLLDNMLSHQSSNDSSELERALQEISNLTSVINERLKRAYNVQKMAQLRRNLIGVDFLLDVDSRHFIREGSLYKLSRKGFQQRLFFLFSDCIIYTSKGVTSTNQFKIHSELPLKDMIIEINEGDTAIPNCFSLISKTKTVIVAAFSTEEMEKWLEDFDVAIANVEKNSSDFDSPLTNSRRNSMQRFSIGQSSEEGEGSVRNSVEGPRTPTQQRSNATMHVCWHRNTSVSSNDHLNSLKNQLSGYLLRKFKNSNGWQKLWVVFCNFCLFFYKSCQDDFPLASLPLLGYTINSPIESDGIKKEFVFKLQFKTHIYFFRAESQYTFSRWLQVISSATATSQRTHLFNRLDDDQ